MLIYFSKNLVEKWTIIWNRSNIYADLTHMTAKHGGHASQGWFGPVWTYLKTMKKVWGAKYAIWDSVDKDENAGEAYGPLLEFSVLYQFIY
jgi:hypothetical protein